MGGLVGTCGPAPSDPEFEPSASSSKEWYSNAFPSFLEWSTKARITDTIGVVWDVRGIISETLACHCVVSSCTRRIKMKSLKDSMAVKFNPLAREAEIT